MGEIRVVRQMLFNWNEGVGPDKVEWVINSLSDRSLDDRLLASPYAKTAKIVSLINSAVPDRLRSKARYQNSLYVGFKTLEDATAFNDDPIHTAWGAKYFKPYRQEDSVCFVGDVSGLYLPVFNPDL